MSDTHNTDTPGLDDIPPAGLPDEEWAGAVLARTAPAIYHALYELGKRMDDDPTCVVRFLKALPSGRIAARTRVRQMEGGKA